MIQTHNQNTTIKRCNWCVWVVCPFSFLLLHPTCVRSMFYQLKETNHCQKFLKRSTMFFASLKKFGLHNSYEQKCSKVIMEKLIVCLTMKGKDVIFNLEFNMLEKHARKMKVVWDMPHLGKTNVEFYANKKCNHAKNEVTYFQWSHVSSTKHVIHGSLKGERWKEKQQFATIFHLLQHGWTVLEFEATKSLFSFSNVPMNLKNHWNDSTGWVMTKCLHKQMFKKMWKIVVCSKYLPLSFDEVTMNDNQLWVSIHCYVIQHWCCLHVFIFLGHVN